MQFSHNVLRHFAIDCTYLVHGHRMYTVCPDAQYGRGDFLRDTVGFIESDKVLTIFYLSIGI